MLRARRSASWRVSSSTCLMRRALSWRSSSSSSRIMICFAWPALRPDTRSSSRSCRAFSVFSSSRVWSRLRRRSSSERSRSSSSFALELERALLRAQPLLQPRELRAPGEQLLLERVAPGGRASLGAGAGRAAPASRPTAGPAWAVRGRCTSITTATATPAATSAANTISISVSLAPCPAKRGHRGLSTLSSLSGAARGRETRHRLGTKRAPTRARAVQLLGTLPNAPLGLVVGGGQDPASGKA